LRVLRHPEAWVFVILLATYAFFWHSRDWNTSSRLMLTYALVDRGTIRLDGLDHQTGDIALYRGHYYCDKLPGYSLLAAVPYALAKTALHLPPHPVNSRALNYWVADYWVTLSVSGLLSALTGVLLVTLARELGCGPRRSALVGLAYGLATPAYAYATLSYGHQASSFALLASFALLWRTDRPHGALRMLAAGFLAAYAAVIELQVGPVSAIVGVYLLVQVVGRCRPPAAIVHFAAGAAVPTLLLLGYNDLAFNSPLDMGYFHHATAIFHDVHSTKNPLGLRAPDASHAIPLLWGGYRGLLFYAPILMLAIPGWIALVARRFPGTAIVSLAVCGAVYLVNLSYPEWTGGWSTGPRLLVPLLPFAMVPVGGLLAAPVRGLMCVAVALAVAGGALNLLFQGAGARIPNQVSTPDGRATRALDNPSRDMVWPIWRGAPLDPPWTTNGRFERNLVNLSLAETVSRVPAPWLWLQFLPLVAFQGVAVLAMSRMVRHREPSAGP
jgi:hypothetical protein